MDVLGRWYMANGIPEDLMRSLPIDMFGDILRWTLERPCRVGSEWRGEGGRICIPGRHLSCRAVHGTGSAAGREECGESGALGAIRRQRRTLAHFGDDGGGE